MICLHLCQKFTINQNRSWKVAKEKKGRHEYSRIINQRQKWEKKYIYWDAWQCDASEARNRGKFFNIVFHEYESQALISSVMKWQIARENESSNSNHFSLLSNWIRVVKRLKDKSSHCFTTIHNNCCARTEFQWDDWLLHHQGKDVFIYYLLSTKTLSSAWFIITTGKKRLRVSGS